jgi:hypothetical protein
MSKIGAAIQDAQLVACASYLQHSSPLKPFAALTRRDEGHGLQVFGRREFHEKWSTANLEQRNQYVDLFKERKLTFKRETYMRHEVRDCGLWRPVYTVGAVYLPRTALVSRRKSAHESFFRSLTRSALSTK